MSEYGQTEMTVLPNGDTIITDDPTMMDLPKDTVIFNEEQTKQIMDNKVDVSGSAHNPVPEKAVVNTNSTVVRPDESVMTSISLEEYIRELQKKYPSPTRTMPQANDGSWIGADGQRYRYPQPGERAYELQKAFEPLLAKIQKGNEEFVSNAVFDHQKQMEKIVKEITNNTAINNISNTRNIQPVVNNNEIHVTLPNVTNSTSADALLRDLQSINLKKFQVNW